MIPEVSATARSFGLDSALVQAIIEVESAGNPWAVRFEPAWRYFSFPREWASRLGVTFETESTLQACSWGLMQIMGSVAREYHFDGPLPRLCEPELGLKYGCMHLSKFARLYPSESDVIAAYNGGSPRKTVGGMYLNQAYVDRVDSKVREIREKVLQKATSVAD